MNGVSIAAPAPCATTMVRVAFFGPSINNLGADAIDQNLAEPSEHLAAVLDDLRKRRAEMFVNVHNSMETAATAECTQDADQACGRIIMAHHRVGPAKTNGWTDDWCSGDEINALCDFPPRGCHGNENAGQNESSGTPNWPRSGGARATRLHQHPSATATRSPTSSTASWSTLAARRATRRGRFCSRRKERRCSSGGSSCCRSRNEAGRVPRSGFRANSPAVPCEAGDADAEQGNACRFRGGGGYGAENLERLRGNDNGGG